MDTKTVKDLMVPLAEYAVVDEKATLFDAVEALDRAQKNLAPGRQPHRAVLVINDTNAVVGKIGQLAFLTALEPKYNVMGDLGTLARAGVRPQFISSMMEHLRLFEDGLTDLCRRAGAISVCDVMRPLTQGIDETATLREAIHEIVMQQTLSVLVMRGETAIGLLRLSDLIDEVFANIREKQHEADH